MKTKDLYTELSDRIDRITKIGKPDNARIARLEDRVDALAKAMDGYADNDADRDIKLEHRCSTVNERISTMRMDHHERFIALEKALKMIIEDFGIMANLYKEQRDASKELRKAKRTFEVKQSIVDETSAQCNVIHDALKHLT